MVSEESIPKGVIVHDQKTAPTTIASPMDISTTEFNRGLKRRKANRESLMEWIRESLVGGTDFQRIKIRGSWSKPFLTKAGAERICGMLGVTATYPGLDEAINRMSAGSEIFVVTCELTNGAGSVVGTGAGGRTMKQDSYDINKVIKMGLKSAMIDATLRVGGLSEVFTQDEESAHDDEIEKPITAEQAKEIRALAKEVKLPISHVAKYFDVEKIEDLKAGKYLRCKKAIERKREEASDGAV